MASRSLGTLTLDLIAKIAGFEHGMDRAARIADKRMKDIQRSAKIAGAAIGTAIVAGVGIAVIGIKSAIDRMDDMSKAAQRVQLPTEQFSQLAYAGSLADVSMEDLQSSLGRLTKSQGLANNETSRQAKLFEALGISVKDASGGLRDSLSVLYDFADVFAANKESPEVMAAGLEIFGRSFQNLIPLLKDGSEGLKAAADESDRLGNTLSTEAGQSAEAFNDNLTRLNTVVKGFWQEVASGMVPALEDGTDRLVDIASKGNLAENVISVLSSAFSAGVSLVDGYSRAVNYLSIQFEVLANSAEGFREIQRNFGPGGLFAEGSVAGGLGKVKAAADAGTKSLEQLNAKAKQVAAVQIPGITVIANADEIAKAEAAAIKKAREFQQRVNAALGGNKTGGGGGGKSGKARELPNFADDDRRALEAMIAAAAQADEAFASMAATLAGPLAQAEFAHSRNLREITDLGREAGRNSEEVAALKAAEVARYDEETEAIRRQLDPLGELLKSLEFENELIGMTNADRATAIQLRGADAASVARYAADIQAANQAIEDSLEGVRMLDDIRGSFKDFFSDVLSGNKSLEDSFKSLADSIASAFLDRAIQNLVDSLLGPQGSGAGGSWGGIFSSLLGAFGGGRANGGPVASGTAYLVGERGPELFVPRTDGSVVTARQTSQLMGGGVTQVNNFQFAAPTDPRSQEQLASKAGMATRRALSRNTA